MIKKIGLGISALLILGILYAALRGSPPESTGGSQASNDSFDEEGRFHDDEGNRIYTIELGPGVSAQEVRAYAEALESTGGHITAAYLYPEGAVIPLHSVSFASSVAQANLAIYESRGFSPWRYAFMRDAGGGVRFVDCRQTPGDELCRTR